MDFKFVLQKDLSVLRPLFYNLVSTPLTCPFPFALSPSVSATDVNVFTKDS